MTEQPDKIEGAPLIRPSTTDHPLYEAVVNACRTVFDPEIPVNIYDLGLVYTVEISTENAVDIAMTLTAPGCPVAGEMPGWVEAAVESVAGVKEIKVNMGDGDDVRRSAFGTGLYVTQGRRNPCPLSLFAAPLANIVAYPSWNGPLKTLD